MLRAPSPSIWTGCAAKIAGVYLIRDASRAIALAERIMSRSVYPTLHRKHNGCNLNGKRAECRRNCANSWHEKPIRSARLAALRFIFSRNDLLDITQSLRPEQPRIEARSPAERCRHAASMVQDVHRSARRRELGMKHRVRGMMLTVLNGSRAGGTALLRSRPSKARAGKCG